MCGTKEKQNSFFIINNKMQLFLSSVLNKAYCATLLLVEEKKSTKLKNYTENFEFAQKLIRKL